MLMMMLSPLFLSLSRYATLSKSDRPHPPSKGLNLLHHEDSLLSYSLMNGDDAVSRVDPFSTVRKMPGSKPSQIVACFGSKDSTLYCFLITY